MPNGERNERPACVSTRGNEDFNAPEEKEPYYRSAMNGFVTILSWTINEPLT